MSKGVEEIVTEIKKKKSGVAKILEERAEEQMQEYEQTKLERMIAEEKAKIQIVQKEGKTLEPKLASDFTARIFQLAEVDPAKAKGFIQSLDQEDLNKIAFLMSAESDRGSAFMNLARSPGTSVKELVELLKIMRPDNGGTDLKGIAEVFKLGMEAAKSSVPQGQQTPIEIFKMVKEFVEPFQQSLGQKDKELWEERMQRLQSQIVNPLEWYKTQKELMKEFGVTAGGKSELDLKILEMQQRERLDNRRLDWEAQIHQEDKEGEKQLYTLIGKAIDGPIAELTKSVGGAAAKRIEGGGGRHSNTPAITQISCPNCQTSFDIITGSQQVICPSCKAMMQLQTQPQRPQTQEQPPATPPQETQAPPQASEVQQSSEASQTEQQPNQQQ